MNKFAIGLLAAAMAAVPAAAMQDNKKNADGSPNSVAGELLFFEFPKYNGDKLMVQNSRAIISTRWNVASIAVHPGDSWQVCQKPRYKEPCMTLTANEPDLGRVRIGSARPSSEVK